MTKQTKNIRTLRFYRQQKKKKTFYCKVFQKDNDFIDAQTNQTPFIVIKLLI